MNEDQDVHTINYNALRAMNAIIYGDDSDFINDKLKECLDHGIISDFAAKDPVWSQYKIVVEDCKLEEPVMEYKNPYLGLEYTLGEEPKKPKKFWPYLVKRVHLPPGWKLVKGCDCHTHMVPSAFRLVDDQHKTVKTLSFFDILHHENKPQRHNVMEMIDAVFDEMENNTHLDKTFTIT